MTVSYTSEVTTCKNFGCFLKLLFKWKASIYKLLWLDIIVYLVVYFTINFIYRFGLDESKKKFEEVVRYCAKHENLIPISFVLAFYVSLIMTRWWSQYTSIPSPDALALLIGNFVKGSGKQTRLIKRNIMRYVCTSLTMCLMMISPKVKKRFPKIDNLVEAGLLLPNEKDIIDDLRLENYPGHSLHLLPLAWASNITAQAQRQGLIASNIALNIVKEIDKFRTKCGSLLDYDWISIPLVYTQVVTLATYSYFLTTLISRQTLEVSDETTIDIVIPVYTILEYCFYIGWLKVAECLMNPFGEDDDDFEVVWLIDRNIQMSFLLVDKVQEKQPPLNEDIYWGEIAPSALPYNSAAKKFMGEYPHYSTQNLIIKTNRMIQPDMDEVKTLRRRHSLTNTNPPRTFLRKFKRHNSYADPESNEKEIEKDSLQLNKTQNRLSDPIPTIQEDLVFELNMTEFNNLKEERQAAHKEKLRKVEEYWLKKLKE